jgi:dolichol-phosphate mannosyltransferase
MTPRLSVVVPVCNEAENVEPLVREIHAALGSASNDGAAYEMIFVDDGSTDDTAAILQRLKAELPALRVLRHSFRSGQSAAVASGVRAARAAWIATLDGDGQNDPADIPRLIAERDATANRGVELFMGNRKASRKDTAFRKLQSACARACWVTARPIPAAASSSFRATCSSNCRASITCIVSCLRCSCARARGSFPFR